MMPPRPYSDVAVPAPGAVRPPRLRPVLRSALPVLLALSAAGALAEESGTADPAPAEPRFSFNGFGTLGVVRSSEDRADYVANPLRPDGAGLTREWSPEIDSRLGLQGTARLTPKITAVLQLVVEQQHDDDIEPTIEWANVKYSFSDDLSLRLGRTALPTFLVSDFRKVGYANPWVRPPVELYGLVPIFQSDGIDVSYRRRLRDWTNTLQATLGFSDVDLPNGSTAEVRELVGLFDDLERGDLTLHATLVTGLVTLSNPLIDALRSFGPQGVALAERFEVVDHRTDFVALGAAYDPGGWFLQAELGRLWTADLVTDKTAGYLSGGRRFGPFTPYLTYAQSRADSPLSTPGLDLSRLPPELVPAASALNRALDEALASTAAQRTLSAGLRWDYHRNAALKLQVDHVDVDAEAFGSFTQRRPDFPRGASATLITVSSDFVF